MVDRMAGPCELRVELVDGFGQEAMTLAVGRTCGDLLEGQRHDAGRQIAEGLGTLRQPGQTQERHPRDHAETRVQGVRYRLGAVCRDPAEDAAVRREDPLEQLASQAGS